MTRSVTSLHPCLMNSRLSIGNPEDMMKVLFVFGMDGLSDFLGDKIRSLMSRDGSLFQ